MHFLAYHAKYIKSSGSPGYRDPWVQIVEFGGTQGNLLVLLTVRRLHLQLHQLFLYPLHCLFLGLYRSRCSRASGENHLTVQAIYRSTSRGYLKGALDHPLLLTFWTSRLSVLWHRPWRSSVPSWRQTAGPSWHQSNKQIKSVLRIKGCVSTCQLGCRSFFVENGWVQVCSTNLGAGRAISAILVY